MKKWSNPELKNLATKNTNDEPTPFYWHPNFQECGDPSNTGEGYQMCKYHKRPCKYFGVLGGGTFLAECSAPSNSQEQVTS